MVFEKVSPEDFEQVVYFNDSKSGLKAIVAMHSTALGPAVGGVRMWDYPTEEDALTDVLRLSKGMTYKAAISGLNWGGGKAVIIGDPKKLKNSDFLEKYGEFVERLGGKYVTAKDVGICSDDLRVIKTKTQHILGIDGVQGSSGDPSPATAWGVFHGMKACLKEVYGTSDFKGKKIAIQGLGCVASTLVGHLVEAGAFVVGCDIDNARANEIAKKYGIELVSPESIYDVPCDIFAPCAMGASINKDSIKRIIKSGCKIVAGAANNQLATPEEGFELQRHGIVYAPDFAINAGGLINIYFETLPGGYNAKAAFDYTARIEQTIADILSRARATGRPPHEIADQIAQERVAKCEQVAIH